MGLRTKENRIFLEDQDFANFTLISAVLCDILCNMKEERYLVDRKT